MSKHEDKALEDILKGREVRKKVQVGGYDKEFSEKMEKEREQEREQKRLEQENKQRELKKAEEIETEKETGSFLTE